MTTVGTVLPAGYRALLLMSGPGNETPTGDSTPSFDFLREHDDGSRTRWPMDPDHDSATDMLPPEHETGETQPDTQPKHRDRYWAQGFAHGVESGEPCAVSPRPSTHNLVATSRQPSRANPSPPSKKSRSTSRPPPTTDALQ